MGEKIEKAAWEKYLDDFTKQHQGYVARIEIVGREFGDQEEAAWLPFAGISYDPHHDQIIVTVGGISGRYPAHLTHMITHPRAMEVHQTPEEDITTLCIATAENTETLVTLRPESQLPE